MTTISPMFCPFSTSLILFSEKICNVKSKEVVHECETEFGLFSVGDVIDLRKRKFQAKYRGGLSLKFQPGNSSSRGPA